jgi:hypothetical protein
MLSAGQGLCYPVGWVRRVGRHEAWAQLGQLRSPPPSQGRNHQFKYMYSLKLICLKVF